MHHYEQWPYEAAAIAFEAIPRTLAQNCGVNVIRTMTALQGKVKFPLFCILESVQKLFICRVFICFYHFSMQMVRMRGSA